MLINVERARQRMDALGLDALVASSPRNVYYASGFWTRVSEWGFAESPVSVVIPRDPGVAAVLVVPEFAIAGLLESPTWIPEIRTTEFLDTSAVAREPEPVRLDPLQADVERLYAERVRGDLATDIVAGTHDALVSAGLSRARVGFDDLRLATHVASKLAGLSAVDAHDAWLDIRKVKTPAEIELLRHGARINETALRSIFPEIRAGARWNAIATRFRNEIQGAGASLISSQKALQFGAEYGGEYFPDLMFADNDWLVRDGQTIIFEAWGTWSNYAFDVSRTAHVGEPSAEYRRLCAEIARGQEEAVKSLRPGRSTAQIMAEMNRIAVSLDVPTPKKTLVFLHSIGLDIIELPTRYPALGRGRDFELEPNTVVNFEFLYFGHSVAPFHLESSYLITGSGAECLHTLPQELLVVG